MNPSSTDIRRMLAQAKEAGKPNSLSGTYAYAAGVEAALAWVLGERKEPPIA
mgnify:CR=1 FL=1